MSWRNTFSVLWNYAGRLTNIKNKTPGDAAGRAFSSSLLCNCEG
jgi:hypothetical protein